MQEGWYNRFIRLFTRLFIPQFIELRRSGYSHSPEIVSFRGSIQRAAGQGNENRSLPVHESEVTVTPPSSRNAVSREERCTRLLGFLKRGRVLSRLSG